MENKQILLVVTALVVSLCMSCNREPVNPENPSSSNNSGEFSNYEEIEAYCLENGWSEASLYVPENYNYDYVDDWNNCFSLVYNHDGTLGLSQGHSSGHSYKFYSNFSNLLTIDTPPIEGYIYYFTCDNQKFGICKFPYDGNQGYSKFYVRRINQYRIKVYYKKCDWPYVE